MKITHLALSWSVSRGRDTYGYTICRLDDRTTGKRYKCIGGGYDMVGTVFGDWLAETCQKELLKIADQAHGFWDKDTQSHGQLSGQKLYGMNAVYRSGELEAVTLDGACGIESMIRIAEAIGLEVQREYQKTGRNRGDTLGWYIIDQHAEWVDRKF